MTEKSDKLGVKITPQTPVKIEEFTLGDVFDDETIKMGVKALISLMNQSAENDKAKFEIAKKELDTQIELRKLDIEEQRLDIEENKNEQKHILWFDIRNKIYTLGMVLIVVSATILLKSFDLLDKSESRAIIILVFGLGMATNTDFIKSIFTKKND